MKLSQIIILLHLVLFGCNGPQTNSNNQETENTPQQWITYNGNPDFPKIVLISGDEEYRSEDALPQLAKILSSTHGFNCTVLFAQDPAKPGIINPNYLHNLPGLKQLSNADLMIIFTRFRALPDDQMTYIDNYLKKGRPVIGLRTATHAFYFKDDFKTSYSHYSNNYDGDDEWKGGFGRLVLGEKWIAHHGHHKHQSTRGLPAEGALDHPILSGIEPGAIWGPSDVYEVRLPLPGDAMPVVMGQVINRTGTYDEGDVLYGMRATDDQIAGIQKRKNKEGTEIDFNPNNPMMPVAWTKFYQVPNGKKGKVFATTMGAATDLLSEGTRRMIVNAVFWTLDKTVPEKANVDTIGAYNPRPFAFFDEQYWINRNENIAGIQQ